MSWFFRKRRTPSPQQQQMDNILHHAWGANANTQELLQRIKLMAKSIEDLTADVAQQGTVIQSAATLLAGLSASIAALKTTQTDPDTAAKIDSLAQQVEAQTGNLQAAVVANTPAEANPSGPTS